jgi:hypothetical protein
MPHLCHAHDARGEVELSARVSGEQQAEWTAPAEQGLRRSGEYGRSRHLSGGYSLSPRSLGKMVEGKPAHTLSQLFENQLVT